MLKMEQTPEQIKERLTNLVKKIALEQNKHPQQVMQEIEYKLQEFKDDPKPLERLIQTMKENKFKQKQ